MVQLSDSTCPAAYFINLLPECKVCGPRDLSVSGVCSDSREAGPGVLFVPLIGQRVDGHDYIQEAYNRGSRIFLLGKHRHADMFRLPGFMQDCLYLAVDDTLSALQVMASNHLAGFTNLKKIGITGSSGKTTTKECLAAIMSRMGNVIYTKGNLNSDIGLPLSVLTVGSEHDFAVFELGMNRVGEMELLADLLYPDYAAITNIGSAHVGQLGSRDAIALEKSRIFKHVKNSVNVVFWEDDDYLDFLQKELGGEASLYGYNSMPGIADIEFFGLSGTRFSYCGHQINFCLPGDYNILNAMCAIRVSELLGAAPLQIKEGLEAVRPLFGRSQVYTGNVNIFADCYNANPESMRSSLCFFASLQDRGNTHYVLGAMKELGAQTGDVHRDLGVLISEKIQSGRVYLFGREMLPAFEVIKNKNNTFYTDSFEELQQYLLDSVVSGDQVFLKGSRSSALERLVDTINLRFNPENQEGLC